MKVLVADDDAVSRRKLEYLLVNDGYDVVNATDGAAAYHILSADSAPPLAVLDLVMPGMNGFEVCRRVRRLRRDIPPYIILLSVRGGKDDVVEGLGAGANDYVVKPFDLGEMMARVRIGEQMVMLKERLAERVRELEEALARARHLQNLLKGGQRVHEFGPFRLEEGEQRLLRDGEPVPLPAKIYDLLLLLVQNSGHLVRKEEIMREVWANTEVEENNLTVSMSQLRKALGGEAQEYVETVPKHGYRFCAEVRRIS
ncbi:MAG TPA: response regulator transcription factor [Pyrinomonadaceae bacterium]